MLGLGLYPNANSNPYPNPDQQLVETGVETGGGSGGAAAADMGQYVEFTAVEVEEAPST